MKATVQGIAIAQNWVFFLPIVELCWKMNILKPAKKLSRQTNKGHN
jgi:hypothetical protein